MTLLLCMNLSQLMQTQLRLKSGSIVSIIQPANSIVEATVNTN